MSAKAVPFGCFCDTSGQALVPADGVPVYAQCPACGFVWRIVRLRTALGIELTIRPSKSGKHRIEFKDGERSTTVEPFTAFPE